MRILLAGAGGVVGRALVPLLITEGHEVFGTTRRVGAADQLRRLGASPINVDVFDRAGIAAAVGEVAPDVVVHQLTALANGSSADNARVRKLGTRNLVDAAVAHGVERVVAQSIAWAYQPGLSPAVESTPLDLHASEPRATTIAGVLALENAVSDVADSVVLRYETLYGPGTWYERDGLIAQRIRTGEVAPTTGLTSFLHVTDAARATISALQWPAGVVNIVDDEPVAGTVWVQALAAEFGIKTRDDGEKGAAWERGADNGYARDVLGWSPVKKSWRSGFDVEVAL